MRRTNQIELSEGQAAFVEQCPGNRECDYVAHCKLAEAHNNCCMFRALVLRKLNMEHYPPDAKMDYYKALAYGKNN